MGDPTRELTVLVLIDALGEGGTERSMAELVRAMRPLGVEVALATLRTRGAEGVEQGLRADGFDVRLLPTGRSRLSTFRALVREITPDLIHSMLFEANLVARLGNIGLGVPLLTSLVNTSYSDERLATTGTDPRKLRIVRFVDAATGRLFVDHFHAVSEAVREDARRHLGVADERISVVPRGRPDPLGTVDIEDRCSVRQELGIPDTATVVVNVGRHEHQKDHPTLVRAMAPLLAGRPDLWLLIAGRTGSESATMQRVIDEVERSEGSDVSSRVRLLGHRSDVPRVLAASDLFVLTSRYEGLPGAVIEAMAAGLPVVASDIGPVREVVASTSARLAPPGDAAGFRAAIQTVLDDPVLAAEMGSAGRARFEQDFRIDSSARALVQLYRKVAGAHGRTRPQPLATVPG